MTSRSAWTHKVQLYGDLPLVLSVLKVTSQWNSRSSQSHPTSYHFLQTNCNTCGRPSLHYRVTCVLSWFFGGNGRFRSWFLEALGDVRHPRWPNQGPAHACFFFEFLTLKVSLSVLGRTPQSGRSIHVRHRSTQKLGLSSYKCVLLLYTRCRYAGALMYRWVQKHIVKRRKAQKEGAQLAGSSDTWSEDSGELQQYALNREKFDSSIDCVQSGKLPVRNRLLALNK